MARRNLTSPDTKKASRPTITGKTSSTRPTTSKPPKPLTPSVTTQEAPATSDPVSAPVTQHGWVRAFAAFALPFVLGHGTDRPDATDHAERLGAMLVAVIRPFLLAFSGDTTPEVLARIEAAAGAASGYQGPLDWPGRTASILELTVEGWPAEVIEAVLSAAPPPFDPGPDYWRFMASREAHARGLNEPDLIRRPAMGWPYQADDAEEVKEPDPYPAREALIGNAWDAHGIPRTVLVTLRQEDHGEGEFSDPGAVYWAVRLATLLAARPRVALVPGPAPRSLDTVIERLAPSKEVELSLYELDLSLSKNDRDLDVATWEAVASCLIRSHAEGRAAS